MPLATDGREVDMILGYDAPVGGGLGALDHGHPRRLNDLRPSTSKADVDGAPLRCGGE